MSRQTSSRRPLRWVLAGLIVGGLIAGTIAAVVGDAAPSEDAPTPDPVAVAPPVVGPEPAGPPTDLPPLPPGLRTALPRLKLDPAVPFKRYAAAPVPITPAPIPEKTLAVRLPGTAGRWCVGGSGRFLVLHLPAARELAVFDLSAATVTKTFPLAADTVHFAAGMDKLFVAYPEGNVLVRYDLGKLEREAVVPLRLPGPVTHLAMGSASAGPLLASFARARTDTPVVALADGAFLLDPYTLARFDVPGFGENDLRPPPVGVYPRFDPEGGVLVEWAGAPQATFLTDPGFRQLRYATPWGGVSHAVPAADGTLHTGGGRYRPDGTRIESLDRDWRAVEPRWMPRPSLPAEHGPLRLQIQHRQPQTASTLEVLTPDHTAPLAVYPLPAQPKADILGPHTPQPPPPPPPPYLLVPDAKALAVLALDGKSVTLHKFDLAEGVKGLPEDAVVVTSRSGGVTPGRRYSYRIAAHARAGGLKYVLDAGPNGMVVSADGEVAWDVPKEFSGPVPVVVTVADAEGRQAIHSFHLASAPELPAAPPAVTPTLPLVAEPAEAFVGRDIVTPARQPVELPRTAVTAPVEIELPSPLDEVRVGGGGRFLLIRLPGTSQLAVVDLCLGKTVKYLPLPARNAPFAAGASTLVVYDGSTKAFQRWNLRTFEKDAPVPNPTADAPTELEMGHAVDGPILAFGGNEGATFRDLDGFRPIPVAGVRPARHRLMVGGRNGRPVPLNVSPDGRGYEDAFESLVLRGSVLYPSVTGREPRRSVLGEWPELPDGLAELDRPVPATGGGWALRLTRDGEGFRLALTRPGEDGLSVPVGSHRVSGEAIYGGAPLPLVRRLVLNPRAGVLAVVDAGRATVRLLPVDPRKLLDAAGPDRVVVLSDPPPADAGKPWAYTPDVWTKTGKPALALVSAPAGMQLAGGSLNWTPPPDYPAPEARVVVSVTDGSGRERYHAFPLPVVGGGAVPKGNPGAIEFADAPPAKPLPPDEPKPAPRKLVKLAVPPVTPPPITPADIPVEGLTVPLPAAVTDACVGGGGRYIILHLPTVNELAVFDVSRTEVVKRLKLPDGPVRFAAGMTKLIVVHARSGVAVRYDLATFQKEATRVLPLGGTVTRVDLGSASAGPLLVAWEKPDRPAFGLFDPITFAEFESPVPLGPLDTPNPDTPWKTAATNISCELSPDGTALVGHWSDVRNEQQSAVLYRFREASAAEVGWAMWREARVGPDGAVYTSGARIPNTGQPAAGLLKPDARPLRPAAHGPLYLRSVNKEFDRFSGQANPPPPGPWEVLAPGEDRPLATFDDLPKRDLSRGRASLTLVPDAKALVALDGDRLVLRKFDLDAALKAADFDHLVVTSWPGKVTPGAAFEYRIAARSARGGLRYAVQSGPAGLTVSDAGTVTWAVPKDFAGRRWATVMVIDKDGREALHSFELATAGWSVATEPTLAPVDAGATRLVAPVTLPDLPPGKEVAAYAWPLGGTVDALCLTPNGRDCLVRLSTPRGVAMAAYKLDTRHYHGVTPPTADAPFAAGVNRLVFYVPDADAFETWALGENGWVARGTRVKNPVGGTPTRLVMGHASDGPLFVSGPRVNGSGSAFLNPVTFQAIVPKKGTPPPENARSLRASPDGRVWTWRTADGWASARLSGMTVTALSGKGEPRLPGPDGLLFAADGLVSTEGKAVGQPAGKGDGRILLPTASGPFVLKLDLPGGDPPGRPKRAATLALGIAGLDSVAVPIPGVEGLPTAGRDDPSGLLDRVMFDPRSGRLLVLNDGRDTLHIHKLNARELLRTSAAEYVAIVGQPPVAVPGKPWRFAPELWTKGDDKVELTAVGPVGLTVDQGAVSWAVPADFAETEVDVTLTAKLDGVTVSRTVTVPVAGGR